MGTLYEMTIQANSLYELLQDEMIDEQTFTDTLQAMGADEKIENYCKVIKELQSDFEKFKNESDRLSARMKTIKNGIDRMKSALLDFLIATNQEKVKSGTFVVSIGKSEQTNIIDETLIPSNFKIPQPEKIDKIAIKKAISEGVTVPGAEIVQNQNIRIR